MPNILAHTHITTSLKGTGSYDVILGSTLFDFQGSYMAVSRDFVGVKDIVDDFDIGVKIHKKTDSRFDAHPETLEMDRVLTSALVENGIDERTAKMTATFAGHLLLDAALLDNSEALDNYVNLKDKVLTNKTSLAKLPGEFAAYVLGFFDQNRVIDYTDPSNVAKITQHRLASRAKASERNISDGQLPALENALRETSFTIGQLGTIAMAKTIDQLRQEVI